MPFYTLRLMDAAGSGAAPTVLATIRPVRLGQNMGVLVVIVIDEEAGIAAAIKMLRAFHEQGALTLYSVAAIARQVGVGAVLREPVGRNEAAAAPSVGAAVGTLLSVLEGPLNAATKTGGRGLIGAVRDLGDVGLDAGLLEQVSRDLNIGGGAIVAEIEELQPFALQSLAVAQRARLFRHRLAGSVTEQRLVREIQLLTRELARVGKRCRGQANSEAALAMQRAHGLELAVAARRARTLAAMLRREAAGKANALLRQASTLEGGARRRLSRRAALIRSGLERRADRLERAAHVGMERQAGDEFLTSFGVGEGQAGRVRFE